jgi:hypothetical protein
MKKHPVCTICGERHGKTYQFKNLLRRFGVDGDKAVPECVATAGREFCVEDNTQKSWIRHPTTLDIDD